MAINNLTTPGVYIQEIQTLPPSIAPVATAIPAFIGYTEAGPKNTPTRITSLVDYNAIFGGPFNEPYMATVDINGNFTTLVPTAITSPSNSVSPYTLYYHLQMYFANGGGPCYIVSIGYYLIPPIATTPAAIDFITGINSAQVANEVTLLVAPEATEIVSDSGLESVYTAMLTQCNTLKNRFSIFDVRPLGTSIANDALNFRSSNIGANYLNYGAAYYPPLNTTLGRNFSDDNVVINDSRPTPITYNNEPNNRLSTVTQGIGTFNFVNVPSFTFPPTDTDTLTITVGSTSVTYKVGADFPTGTVTLSEIVSIINQNPTFSSVARAQVPISLTTGFFVVVRNLTDALTITPVGGTFTVTSSPTGAIPKSQNSALYNKIESAITSRVLTLPPSATMAGIYAAVDNDRGVWKAPANVGVANISGPSINVTESDQGNLNIDATSGKSIDVIRAFTGRGSLVWGARTLDGNSNEWRYVPVRRLFIFAETSIKLAVESMVFEPNDANTWLRVKSMISNFLTDLWRQGALTGDKPEQAYFVRVGLGDTMTADDILNGRMIVTIGLAAVRPAEFIVLQFVQQLQTS